jgi:hypothetical protein
VIATPVCYFAVPAARKKRMRRFDIAWLPEYR